MKMDQDAPDVQIPPLNRPRINQGKGRSSSFLHRPLLLGCGALVLLPIVYFLYAWITFPSDHTPEGAYLRIVKAVNQGHPQDFFAYTEEEAQHACFTILDYRKRMLELAGEEYPRDSYQQLEQEHGVWAQAEHGSEIFALMVKREGWLTQLRADVSGIKNVTVNGLRATIVTSKGTRYSLRKRPGGIWGLTAFTPSLAQEARRAARDLEQVERAAADFARADGKSKPAAQASPQE